MAGRVVTEEESEEADGGVADRGACRGGLTWTCGLARDYGDWMAQGGAVVGADGVRGVGKWVLGGAGLCGCVLSGGRRWLASCGGEMASVGVWWGGSVSCSVGSYR